MKDEPSMSETVALPTSSSRADAVNDFARSALFDRTFQDGMDLVEDTAAYLDGLGRQESRLLSRSAALAYANHSMRLTTQLMQVASWLLVQRAVREGDMSATEACEERYRLVRRPAPEAGSDDDEGTVEDLPSGLKALLERTERIYERVAHLDLRMYRGEPVEEADHPVLSQHDRLRSAFGG
jgi:regulator of CtrA degradation